MLASNLGQLHFWPYRGATPACPEQIEATSLHGTKRKCRNARIFPELGVGRLCHQAAGHSRL